MRQRLQRLRFNLNSGRSPASVRVAKGILQEAEPWWTVWVDDDGVLVVEWHEGAEPPEGVAQRVLEFFDLDNDAAIGAAQ